MANTVLPSAFDPTIVHRPFLYASSRLSDSTLKNTVIGKTACLCHKVQAFFSVCCFSVIYREFFGFFAYAFSLL